MSEGEDTSRTPRHIAVVMDGNGRWAKKRFLPRSAGHRAGVGATRAIVENCAKKGVEALTVFAFSSENWNRPENEVNALMSLFISTLSSEMKKLKDQNVRVRFIGERAAFPGKLQDVINETESETGDNTGLILTIAANYGGRWDIVEATRLIAAKVAAGELAIDEITEELMSEQLCLSGLPAIDLFIRTGDERRISNFLLWQLAYTELYFTDTLWPDFNEASLDRAIAWYATRQRRFGKTSEQVEDKRTVAK